MNRLYPIAAALALAFSSVATAAHKTQKIEPLVKVNGTTITNLDFAVFAAQQPGGTTDQSRENRIALLNELVNITIVADSAEGRKIAKTPEIAAAIRMARTHLIAQALVQERLHNTPVSEQEIQAAYDKDYLKAPNIEIKARHILLGTKEAAEKVIAELNKGADFATLAKKDSIGPSKAEGGELGWFSPDQMVKPFSEALVKLKDGEYTKTPVHTQFGWHVIKREATRKTKPPALSTVREQIVRQIRSRTVAKFIQGLREKAKIEILHNAKASK